MVVVGKLNLGQVPSPSCASVVDSGLCSRSGSSRKSPKSKSSKNALRVSTDGLEGLPWAPPIWLSRGACSGSATNLTV